MTPNHQCSVCGGFLEPKERISGHHSKCGPQSISEEVISWPTSEGLWMAYFDAMGCWFPIKCKALRDDLDAKDPNPPILAIIAQFPESETSWPFTFRHCHPAKRWRRPTDEEIAKADKFYGLSEIQKSGQPLDPLPLKFEGGVGMVQAFPANSTLAIPQCRHRNPMRDSHGEVLRPPCGCKLEDYILDAVFAKL